MTKARFTWDPKKAASNLRDHRVSFDEASSAIDDPLALVESDQEHGETRLNVLGLSSSARVLFVVTIVYVDGVYHIISARKAERHERKRYEEGDY